MKWVFAILVVLNVCLYLWATGHKNISSPLLRPVINSQGMRLLSEIYGSQSDRQSTSCYRIGPFSEKSGSTNAVGKLEALSVPYTALTIKVRELRAYRVYLGPFTTQGQIEQQREVLRNSRVNEHYVKSESRDKDVISLGLFSQRGRAGEFIDTLRRKNIVAKIRPENRTLGPTHWLELRDSDTNQEVLGALRETRWVGDQARLRSFPCS